jgi:hypothetical protein
MDEDKCAGLLMKNTHSAITVSDEISSEVAAEILTKQIELNRDPQELLGIVLAVHTTLRELSERAHESRFKKMASR